MTYYAQIWLILANCGRIYGQKWPDLWPNEIVGMAMAIVAIPDITSMYINAPNRTVSSISVHHLSMRLREKLLLIVKTLKLSSKLKIFIYNYNLKDPLYCTIYKHHYLQDRVVVGLVDVICEQCLSC